jgi:hypothetical protein
VRSASSDIHADADSDEIDIEIHLPDEPKIQYRIKTTDSVTRVYDHLTARFQLREGSYSLIYEGDRVSKYAQPVRDLDLDPSGPPEKFELRKEQCGP